MDSPVSQFFDGKCLFVTGFSGFLGKVLVAKLIKNTNARTIYVLIRDKNGVNHEQRTNKILSEFPFIPDKNGNINQSNRVKPIKGDLTLPGLGIEHADLEKLRREVSVVFHSAAEVRFNIDIRTNYEQNVGGTFNLIKLCRTFDNVQSFVHISSLYSVGNKPVVEETVQPLDFDFNALRKGLSDHLYSGLDDCLQKLDSQFPNSYTLTKALAENVVQQEIGNIPTAIIRPSIVLSSYEEPAPGWSDTLQGFQGIVIAAATGLLQVVNWNYETRFEMVPVDICANVVIASAWYMAEKSSAAKLEVINVSTGPFFPEWTFGRYFCVAHDFANRYPSSKQLRPLMKPPMIRKASILFPIQKFIYHTLFALLVDSLLGHKKFLYKYTCKLNEALDHVVFFISHSYQIKTGKYIKLIETMSKKDRVKFKADLRDLEIVGHIRDMYFGLRKYFLLDEATNIEENKARARLICFVYRTIQFLFVFFFGLTLVAIHRLIFT